MRPIAWPRYNDYWDPASGPTSDARRLLPLDDARIEFVAPRDAGADGVIVWGNVQPDGERHDAASLQGWVDEVLTVLVAELDAPPTPAPTPAPTTPAPTTSPSRFVTKAPSADLCAAAGLAAHAGWGSTIKGCESTPTTCEVYEQLNNDENPGRTCESFCGLFGLACGGGWRDADNGCDREEGADIGCAGTDGGSSDHVCLCAAPTGSPSPSTRAPTPKTPTTGSRACDTFGVARVYPTATGGATWTSAWHGGAAANRTLTAVAPDPADPSAVLRGSGSLAVDGARGVASMAGSPRYYVLAGAAAALLSITAAIPPHSSPAIAAPHI